MKWFELIDRQILKFFTKIAYRFQDLFGKNNFFLARIFYMLGVLSMLPTALDYWFDTIVVKSTVVDLLIYVLLVVVYAVGLNWATTTMENEFNDPGDIIRNKPAYIIATTSFSGYWVLVSLYFGFKDFIEYFSLNLYNTKYAVFELITCMFWFLMLAGCYFSRVNPRPPMKGKIREWIEGLSRRIVPVRNET
jgi:hypothetical protein